MKKFWFYLAVPAVLLNGCQRQEIALEEAENLVMESRETKSQDDSETENKEERETGSQGESETENKEER